MFAADVDAFDRNYQEMWDAEPSEYIDHIEIITDQDHRELAKFVSAKVAEVYGTGIVVEVHPSEIKGQQVIVHGAESDDHYWNREEHNKALEEVQTFVEGII
jgi:hypothetical protein